MVGVKVNSTKSSFKVVNAALSSDLLGLCSKDQILYCDYIATYLKHTSDS